MKARMAVLTLVVSSWTWAAMAQGLPPQDFPPGGHMPPPQAYEDCRGKKAGDTVQHTTREGKVAATCLDSPQGLVARPNQLAGVQADLPPPQAPLPLGPQPRCHRSSVDRPSGLSPSL